MQMLPSAAQRYRLRVTFSLLLPPSCVKPAPALVVYVTVLFLCFTVDTLPISLTCLVGLSFDDGSYKVNFLIPNGVVLVIIGFYLLKPMTTIPPNCICPPHLRLLVCHAARKILSGFANGFAVSRE